MTTLQREIDAVLARDSCTGCGMCAQLDSGISMALDGAGYLRPSPSGPSAPIDGAAEIFRRSCPGVRVHVPTPAPGATRDPLMGSALDVWRAWATDESMRLAGSSGGVLTALHAWLIAEGRAARIVGAAAGNEPRRTVPVTIMSRGDALAAAGSRYAPVGVLANPDALGADAIVGKPCEIAAARRSSEDLVAGEPPLLLSFFCAGTPSQHATDALLTSLDIAVDDPVTALRYRGNGWPGRFTATSAQRTVSADYDESWGKTLGPATQWRCKMCPDGVGESADIVCADSWETDERGYPTFAEGAGMSALIVRTERGRRVIAEALRAGVIEVEPLKMSQLVAAQPLQVNRRRFLWARILGSRLAGRPTPSYRGFGLLRFALFAPRTALRTARGTYRRVKSARPRR